MPYNNEFANPQGHISLFNNNFVKNQLKNLSFDGARKESSRLSDQLLVKEVGELEEEKRLEDIKYSTAIDGSITKLDSPYIELAGIKIGTVIESFHRREDLAKNADGPIDPRKVEKAFMTFENPFLIPGTGVTLSDSDLIWQDVFRNTFYEILKNIVIPQTNDLRLEQIVKELWTENNVGRIIDCFHCSMPSPQGFKVDLCKSSICENCNTEYYSSDGLFKNWEGVYRKLGEAYSHIMTTVERLIMLGLIDTSYTQTNKLPFDKTIFINDGSLVFHGMFNHLNTFILNKIQSYSEAPMLISLEKTGAHVDFAMSHPVQDRLEPGNIALIPNSITRELTPRLPNNKHLFTLPAYGKRFIYKSRNGLRTFVFMAVPNEGSPSANMKESPYADVFENYSYLKLYCEFFEKHSINQFGLDQAALEVIAKANHTASLPRDLSANFLKTIVEK